MDDIPCLVIKVSYEDMLRRFSTPLTLLGQLDLDMTGLRKKIISLFSLPADAELNLTYIDEDGDAVALVDDNDLHDVMYQSLKFLKINVKLKDKPVLTSPASSCGAISQLAEDQLKNLDKGISDILATFPEPLLDTVSKLSKDLASKAVSTSPVLGEILDCLSKLAQQGLKPQESSPAVASMQAPTRPVQAPTTPVDTTPPNANAQFKVPSGVDCQLAGVKYFDLGTASSSEHPISGVCMNVDSRGPFDMPTWTSPLKKNNNSAYNSSTGMFHKGICCDGCGALPIIGPRFKSTIKVDYDLCSICFSKMGDMREYMKIDRPQDFGWPFKGITGPGQRYPSLLQHKTPPPRGLHFMSKPMLDSCFILDVNVVDGTVMEPATSFTKIWRMKNNGSLNWPRGTQLVWIGGDKLSNRGSVEIEVPEDGVQVDEEVNVAVDFRAPALPGRYISYWMMASSSGMKFGQSVWVLIHVESSPKEKEAFWSCFRELDLNVPPPDASRLPVLEDSSVSSHSDHSDSSDHSDDSDNSDLSNSSDEFLETGEPVGDVFPETLEQSVFKNEAHALVVGENLDFPSTNASSSQNPLPVLQQPITDLSGMVLGETSGEASVVKDVPVLSKREVGNDEVEQALMEGLDEMGFKQVDVNKKVLRKNEYNLEQSVADLCGFDDWEWDPILDELQEMGFCDEETNKMLLKKNNGSIKRVVMDLITGEKE